MGRPQNRGITPALQDNHYGWFERAKTGYYDLSPQGRGELGDWSDALRDLAR